MIRCEVSLGQTVDGREALGEDLPVAPVAAVDVILDRQEEGLAHGGGLLADGEVGRPLMDVGDVAVLARPLDLIQHRLELADEDHVPVDPDRVVCREGARDHLVGERATVLVDRDSAQLDRLGASDLVGR